MKHDKALLAVDLVQMALLQGLVNERVSKIDADKQDFEAAGAGPDDAIETALLRLRDTLRRATQRQFPA